MNLDLNLWLAEIDDYSSSVTCKKGDRHFNAGPWRFDWTIESNSKFANLRVRFESNDVQ